MGLWTSRSATDAVLLCTDAVCKQPVRKGISESSLKCRLLFKAELAPNHSEDLVILNGQ